MTNKFGTWLGSLIYTVDDIIIVEKELIVLGDGDV